MRLMARRPACCSWRAPFGMEFADHDSSPQLGRVDQWRGGRLGLRFHWPLVEPEVQFSRIRLSDKDSRLRFQVPSRSRLEPEGTLSFAFAPCGRLGQKESWHGTTAMFFRVFSLPNPTTVEDRQPISNACAAVVDVV